MNHPRPRVLVSRCLLGEEVRYNGGHTRDRDLTELVGPLVEWVPVCPEVEIGMGAPREPVVLVRGRDGPRMRGAGTGRDWTDEMTRFSSGRLQQLRGRVDGAILKKGSPSCGLFGVEVYDGVGGPPVATGGGLFARKVVDDILAVSAEDEDRLQDPVLRERFFDRLFAAARWREFRAGRPDRGALVVFHARHRYTLSTRNHDAYRELGRLVATAASAHDFESVLDAYGDLLDRAMSSQTTRVRHAGTLRNLSGFLPADVARGGTGDEVSKAIDEYQSGLVPRIVPTLAIRRAFERGGGPSWALDQTYLDPYPATLMLGHAI